MSRKDAIKTFVYLLCISFLILFSLTPLIFAWQGKVVGITDGDTITALHAGKGEKIRLYGIDTPEKHQDFGAKAKQFTSSLLYGKEVEVIPETLDRYGRTIGLVYIKEDNKCVNEEIIQNGFAWVYREYCDKPICKGWLAFEEKARKAKIGLWAGKNPVSPWDFRHGTKEESSIKKETDEKPFIENQPNTNLIHGNVSSKIFHKSNCRYYNCINCTAVFSNREEALNMGYRPCKICRP